MHHVKRVGYIAEKPTYPALSLAMNLTAGAKVNDKRKKLVNGMRLLVKKQLLMLYWIGLFMMATA
jgi:hypothetical protein